MLRAFHLTLATLLELFHPCYLSNVYQIFIKQGQIDVHKRYERQVERTYSEIRSEKELAKTQI